MRGVVKRFGSVTALDGVDLDVAAGWIAALVGPNGAGKTTLLRILSTTVLPDLGTASVAGHDVRSASSAVRRSIGMSLGTERSWYWRLSGRRNLEFFAVVGGMRRAAARLRVEEVLEQFGLTAAADRTVACYSSGMQARLSLARALLRHPSVLVCDEPTRALDPAAAFDFRSHVRALADQGCAVVLATHDVYEATGVADVVVVLADGRVHDIVDPSIGPGGLEQVVWRVARTALR